MEASDRSRAALRKHSQPALLTVAIFEAKSRKRTTMSAVARPKTWTEKRLGSVDDGGFSQARSHLSNTSGAMAAGTAVNLGRCMQEAVLGWKCHLVNVLCSFSMIRGESVIVRTPAGPKQNRLGPFLFQAKPVLGPQV
jgi:hypothetical protein